MKSFYSQILVAIFGLTVVLLTTPTDAFCRRNWALHGTRCYYFQSIFDDRLLTYDEAQNSCVFHTGSLVEINSAEEDEYIRSYISLSRPNGVDIWIGATDRDNEGTWLWNSGASVIRNSLWRRGRPDNWRGEEHCLIKTQTLGWDDRNCNSRYKYVCEKAH